MGKNATNVENQLMEIRKSLHQRYHYGKRKPHNQNQPECKIEDKSNWCKKYNTYCGLLDDPRN